MNKEWTSRVLWIMAHLSLLIGFAKLYVGGASAISSWSDSIYQAYFVAMLYDVWCKNDD